MPIGNRVTQLSLKQKLSPFLAPYWATNMRTYAGFADQFYCCPEINEVRLILESLSSPTPKDEVYDCDDFAYELKAHASRYARLSNDYSDPIAIGIAWGRFRWVDNGQSDHACNWFLDSTYKFHWIEPQNKQFYDSTECCGYLNLLLV